MPALGRMVGLQRGKRNEDTMTIKLGDLAKDKITGFTGVAVCESKWLRFEHRRIMLQSRELHDGVPIEPVSFDEPQLELVEPDVLLQGIGEPARPPVDVGPVVPSGD
jgi:hypothetical protein